MYVSRGKSNRRSRPESFMPIRVIRFEKEADLETEFNSDHWCRIKCIFR